MISDRALVLAVERSLITVEQRDSLQAIEAEIASVSATTVVSEPVDDEALRFVTGFADIFVTIGIALFIGALGFITRDVAGVTAAFAAATLATWLLAEFFTRRRRMALPSIALLVVFVGAGFVTLLSLMEPTWRGQAKSFWLFPSANGFELLLVGLATVALAALHYYRFRVPITVAAGTAALCIATGGAVFGFVPNLPPLGFNLLILTCGLLTFALGMRFDVSDPARATRRTDIAFWLHLLAAPMIVHTLIRGVLHFDALSTATGALGVLGVFMALGLVAVIIDRRAILVSGLVYAGIAFGTLIKTLGLERSSLLFPIVLLILGAFILLLSAGWHPLRRFLLRRLPAALASRLPHPLVPSAS